MFWRALLLAGCWGAALLVPGGTALAQGVTLSLEFYYGETKVADVTEVLTLAPDGKSYELTSHAAAVGLAKLLHGDSSSSSRGRVDETHGLLMSVYQAARGNRPPQRAERQEGRLLLQRGDERREVAVSADTPVFDHLTAIYRSHILGRPVAGVFQHTNGWRFKEYDYQIVGTETVDTGMGEMEAVLMTRESARGERKIWLAPALDYLPVRVYVNDKGHEFTTILKGVGR